MASIKPIDNASIHKIQSGQVIVDLCSVVKELIENSIDAGATTIDIRFKNQGLESIEVQDNGSGIDPENYETVALKHYTSKISSYDDLERLETFGFRGEALSSLSALSKLSITTCLARDVPKGAKLLFRSTGVLDSTTVVAAQKGTTVLAEQIFHTLPVRRRELERNIKREWNKVVTLLNQYACILTGVKFSVSQQPNKGRRIVLFTTHGNSSTRDNIANIFGAKTLSVLIPLELQLRLQPTRSTILRNLAQGIHGRGKTGDDDDDDTSNDDSTNHDGTRESGDIEDDNEEARAAQKEDRKDKRSGNRQDQEQVNTVTIVGHVSRPVNGEGRQTPDRQMFFVNGRPCALPQFAKVFNEVYKSYNLNQSPFIFANVQLDTHLYDVNVSPDKRTILLHDQRLMLESLREALITLFDSQDYSVPVALLGSTPQPKSSTTLRGTTPSIASQFLAIDTPKRNALTRSSTASPSPTPVNTSRDHAKSTPSFSTRLHAFSAMRLDSNSSDPGEVNGSQPLSQLGSQPSETVQEELTHEGSVHKGAVHEDIEPEEDSLFVHTDEFITKNPSTGSPSTRPPGTDPQDKPFYLTPTLNYTAARSKPVIEIGGVQVSPETGKRKRPHPSRTLRDEDEDEEEEEPSGNDSENEGIVRIVAAKPVKINSSRSRSQFTKKRVQKPLPSFGGRLVDMFSAASKIVPASTLLKTQKDIEIEEDESDDPEVFLDENIGHEEDIADEDGIDDEDENENDDEIDREYDEDENDEEIGEEQLDTRKQSRLSEQRYPSRISNDRDRVLEDVDIDIDSQNESIVADEKKQEQDEDEDKHSEEDEGQEKDGLVENDEESTILPQESNESKTTPSEAAAKKAGVKYSTLHLQRRTTVEMDSLAKYLASWRKSINRRSPASSRHQPAPRMLTLTRDRGSGLAETTTKAEEKLSLTIAKNDFNRMKIVGQFNLGFILALRPVAVDDGIKVDADRSSDRDTNKQSGRDPQTNAKKFKLDQHDELFIIDQHATDEKYNFERLQSTTVLQSQRLVQPKTLDLTAVEEEIVLQNLPALTANGFKIDVDQSGDQPVGRRCRLVALPVSRETTFTLADLEELIALLAEHPTHGADDHDEDDDDDHYTSDDLSHEIRDDEANRDYERGHETSCDKDKKKTLLQTLHSIPRPSKVRKMFAMRACRSSIMIGRALTKKQMTQVVRHMSELDKPWNCPHGRPTMRHLCSLDDWNTMGRGRERCVDWNSPVDQV